MNRSLVVIGAGPVGLEAATLALAKGWDVRVYESGEPGQGVADWGHVRFFSPWSLNRSEWGNAALGASDRPDEFPTGDQYRETYLLPLARRLPDLHTHTRVLGVSRRDALKGEFIGARANESGPFLLHVMNKAGRESFVEADYVLDCSGLVASRLGPGGLDALGESTCESRIHRNIPDVLGTERERFEGKRVLVVGAGHSAVTSLKLLSDLGAEIEWAFRGDQAPYRIVPNDSLPERDSLSKFGNEAAGGRVKGVSPLPASTVEAIEMAANGSLRVTLWRPGGLQEIVVDEIVSNVGFRPDLSLTRELQVHYCYASEGPMKLAATLLSSAGGDCLAQSSSGVETLINPETNFFVLGTKSYGRNSSFLLKIGIEQIHQVFQKIGES